MNHPAQISNMSMVRYETAVRALAECKAVDEVKAWVDKAAALKAYARMAKDKTLEVDSAEIRIRAERRLGEMIIAQKETVGLNTGAQGIGKSALLSDEGTRKPTLADAGIDHNLSSRSQKLAAVPEPEFESEVEEWRGRVEAEGARVTSRLEAAGDREIKKQPKPITIDDQLGRIAELEALLAEREDECRELISEAKSGNDEYQSMLRIVEADDHLAQAHAEVKRFTELNRVLQERLNGKMAECNGLAKDAKRWMNKFLVLDRKFKALDRDETFSEVVVK